jgi:citrate synthase
MLKRMTSLIDVPRGLAGVAVTDTTVGDVRGEEGFYHYRQYNAVELARTRSFEDVWRLLLDGDLPAKTDEAAEFALETSEARRLSPSVLTAIDALGLLSSPDAELRAAVAAVGAGLGLSSIDDLTAPERRRDTIAMAAAVPSCITALHRRRHGLPRYEPERHLGVVEDYLRGLIGDAATPTKVRALEQYLVGTMDHGFNASTFTARVVTGAGADVGAAVVAALGALSGPRHGGAPSRALDMFDDIGTPDRARSWVRRRLDQGHRISGFGHAVYRTTDPRSVMLAELAESLGGPYFELAREVEAIVLDELAVRHPERPLATNVEFWASVVLDAAGVPRELFTSTFSVARVIGWSAHILEQAADSKIIRPSARYTGPRPPVPVPA